MMLSKILYFTALAANIIAVLALIILAGNVRSSEMFILILCFIPPILAIAAIYKLPDFEERKLSRKLAKAQLRKELKKLGEDA